jgi:hypothetical protein
MGQNESRVVAIPPAEGAASQQGTSVKISPALIAQINRTDTDVTEDKLRMAYEKGVNDMREHIEENHQLINAYDLVQEQTEIAAREENERRYINHMTRTVSREQHQIRQEMPCLAEQQATLKCYQRQKETSSSGQVLDCGDIVDAYLHCTAKGRQ